MRDYKIELEKRVEFIREALKSSGAKGIIYGNSGGKDCTLAAIIAKHACENVLGVIMPCHSNVNYGQDREDANKAAEQFGIEQMTVDISEARTSLESAIRENVDISADSLKNMAPRLRMTTLYTIAQTKGYLVLGTGNRSEMFMGYFTKWGDGGYDLNPIADLTVREVYEFLRYLNAPESIIQKAPSAGLYEGQTDEKEMGFTYDEIDDFILYGKGDEETKKKLERIYERTAHKRQMPMRYGYQEINQ
ncbi:MAG: NAD(+) synthase [Ruminococcaceae bacterium]|nr:NAD(+) synthase [Oscillospiraceae bacterium]